jgi:hypothetical protein
MSPSQLPRATFFVLLALSLHIAACAWGLDIMSRDFGNDNTRYEAPLINADAPLRVEGSYCVYLYPGHTMEKHSEVIGIDMERYSGGTLGFVDPNIVAYFVTDIDQDFLKRIREDPGVDFVTCDIRKPPGMD